MDLDRVEDAVADAVRALSHEALTESGGIDMEANELPETANDMRAIAELQQADWVVVPIVHDHGERAYYVTLRVGYAPLTRVEELDAEVRRTHEADRLRAILQAMLRPEGVGEDGLALAGEDAEGRRLETLGDEEARREAEEQARLEAEEQARLEAEEQARLEAEARAAEEAAQREAQAFENRDRYGNADGLTHLQAGVSLRPLVASGGDGGVLGTFTVRVGRGFEGINGLELRGGFDVFYGTASGFSFFLGGAYLFSPFATPL
ncbi:MAG: hypothetical protein AAGE52_42590, partial [Myxococcota bacterium]